MEFMIHSFVVSFHSSIIVSSSLKDLSICLASINSVVTSFGLTSLAPRTSEISRKQYGPMSKYSSHEAPFKSPVKYSHGPTCSILQEWQHPFFPLYSMRRQSDNRVIEGRSLYPLGI